MLGALVGGRYRLERELGRGGFGAVYVAVQEDLGRRVALKLLHRRHLDGVGFDRFRREAQLAQHLSHPNTVRLFDFGLHDGTPFIAFELLAGESLASLLQRSGALPPQRVAHLTAQILKSLMEAHDQGIVHRDVKPANVFVCTYAGEPDFVKVLDFGIAKSVEEESAPLTGTGEAVGTPSYMPPEQLSGGVLGPATDLYAVGLIMAEMIGGVRVMSGSAMEIAMRQLDLRPLEFPEAVRASPLWPIIARATQKQAAQRFRSAADMLTALQPLRSGAADPVPGALSATVPAQYAHAASGPSAPESATVPFTPQRLPPAAPAGRTALAGVGLLALVAGVAVVGALAVFGVWQFVDLDGLLGRGASAGAADGGTAPDAGAPEPGSGAAARASGSAPPVSPGPGQSTGPAKPAGGAVPSASASSGPTLGKVCKSSADCTGAHEKCGEGGTCQCQSGAGLSKTRACGSRCVLNTDPDNCGACGKRCANDEVCTTNMGGSVESPICYQCTKGAFGSARILCGPHVCVAPNTDPRNCGGCNKKCAAGQSCEGGVCK